ncbi:MAG: hypothetical protein OJF52_003306 [Nitrospira sp.]|nr:MAG: hypothetical protein OJF52_003306 [Nitrospira sp.]
MKNVYCAIGVHHRSSRGQNCFFCSLPVLRSTTQCHKRIVLEIRENARVRRTSCTGQLVRTEKQQMEAFCDSSPLAVGEEGDVF